MRKTIPFILASSLFLLACGEDVHSIRDDIQNPDIQNPDIQNPDIQNPDIQNPDIQNPDIQNPDIQNPDIQNPDIQNPDVQNPDIQNPDVQNPDIQNPDKSIRPVFPGKPGTHEPTLPDTPNPPDTPVQPDNPDTPNIPDTPDIPDEPAPRSARHRRDSIYNRYRRIALRSIHRQRRQPSSNQAFPLSNQSNTRPEGGWPLGGHFCLYYGDSPGGTQKCNAAAKAARDMSI